MIELRAITHAVRLRFEY